MGDLQRRAASQCRAFPRSSARSSTSSTSTRRTTCSSTSPPLRSRTAPRATSRSDWILPVGGEFGELTLEGGRLDPPAPDRPAAHLRLLPRHRHGRPGGRLPAGAMTVSSFTSLLIWLPIGAAIAVWVLPLSRYATGSLAVLVSLVEVGIWIEQAARFDFSHTGCSSRRDDVDQGPPRLVPRRRVRVLALARRPDGRRDGGRDRLRLLGRPRPPARVLRADALPHRRDRRRLRLAGSAALLRVLRGDADPALRARRRVGRPGPARRDGQVRHLHDGGLAAHARRADRLRAEGRTFDLVDGPTSVSRWIFLGFMLAFVIKAPLFPFHGWLPDAYRQAPPEVAPCCRA